MQNNIKTIKKNTVFKNKYLELQNNYVEFPNKTQGEYLKIIENSSPTPGIVVCCKNEENEYLLIDIFRYGINKRSLEFIRGYTNKNEEFILSAKRELFEESGINVDNIISNKYVGSFYINTSNTLSEIPVIKINIKNVDEVSPQTEESIINILWKSSIEMESMIRNGVIKDSFTISAYQIEKLVNVG